MERRRGQIEHGEHILVEIGRRQIDEPLQDYDANLTVALLPILNEANKTNPLAPGSDECREIDRGTGVITKRLVTKPILEFEAKELLTLGIEARAFGIDGPERGERVFAPELLGKGTVVSFDVRVGIGAIGCRKERYHAAVQ